MNLSSQRLKMTDNGHFCLEELLKESPGDFFHLTIYINPRGHFESNLVIGKSVGIPTHDFSFRHF